MATFSVLWEEIERRRISNELNEINFEEKWIGVKVKEKRTNNRKFPFLILLAWKQKSERNKEGMGGLKDKQRLKNWGKSICTRDVSFCKIFNYRSLKKFNFLKTVERRFAVSQRRF